MNGWAIQSLKTKKTAMLPRHDPILGSSGGVGIVIQREELLVHFPPFIDIRMEVNFSRLNGGMPEILLNDPQVL